MPTRIPKNRRNLSSSRLTQIKTPVQRRSIATVEAILAGAAQVFEANGYGAGTTNRIAEASGVAIGTLYQYFPSKEALAVALLERHIEETLARLQAWVGHIVTENHSLAEALADYVGGMLDVHSQRPRLQHIMLEETPLPERVHHLLLEAEHQAARTMAGLLRTYPGVRRPNLEHAAYVIIHTVEAVTHRFAAHPEDQIIKAASLKEEIVTLLYAYLLTASVN
jgi:AcrR family transcriptional regulator